MNNKGKDGMSHSNLDMNKFAGNTVSIIIPCLNAESYIPILLKSIEAQTYLPNEIIIIDSSTSGKTGEIISNWPALVPIIYKRVDLSMPGHARNTGVKLASGKWIAFLDCRTVPHNNWLETSMSIANEYQVEFVGGLFLCGADTHFKRILRSATYGMKAIRSLPGSIVLRKVFEKHRGFIPSARAGEDLEWLERIKNDGVKIRWLNVASIEYNGLLDSLFGAVRKWYIFALSSSKLNVRSSQKYIYLFIFIVLCFFLIYNWNSTFANWDENSKFYFPNATKIYIGFLFLTYLVVRGIVRPLRVNLKISDLFPFHWIEISFVGFCLDVSKAPGLIWGSFILLSRKISGAINYFRSSIRY